MAQEITIRPADPSRDAGCCVAIYAPYVRETAISFEIDPPDTAEMSRRMEVYGESHGWLIAEADGAVLGYAYGSPHRSREAYAPSCDVAIYLHTGARRQGIGRALYSLLLPALAERSYHAAFAGISLPNPASVALHQAMGFTAVGIYREVGWKLGRWQDVGWWQRLL